MVFCDYDYVNINIQMLDPEMEVPSYATADAAGMDIRATQKVVIAPGTFRLVPCGFCIEIPRGYEAQIRPRSGNARKYGVTVLNSPGTIDSDYRGEVGVILINLGTQPFVIDKYDRIAQMVIAPVASASLTVVAKVGETVRGTDGFGSTGNA